MPWERRGRAPTCAGAWRLTPGAATRNPLTMASVAGASVTACAAAVVTVNDTRYLSAPEVARTWRREVLSVISFSRYVPSMTADGKLPRLAIEAFVVCHASSRWLSTKPCVMASAASKSPTSLYTTTCAFDVYTLLPPTRSAITTKASGTLGSGTWVQRGGIGSGDVERLETLGPLRLELDAFAL